MKNRICRVWLGMLFAGMQLLGVGATEYVWSNNTDASTIWETAANWNGAVPDPRSTSAGDLADPVQIDFGTLTTYQKIQGWDLKGKSEKYIHLDKLSSAGAPREIQLSKDGNGTRGISLYLRDVSDFNGYFTVDPKGNSSGTSAAASILFQATEAFVPHLRYVMGSLPFTYYVPTAARVQIGNVLGGGRFRLNSSHASYQGAVELMVSPGGETSPYLNGGKLVLHGATKNAETVLARAALHLDAAAAETLSFDGPYLSGWTDSARQITVVPESSGSNRPTLTNNFANALPAVNFGRFFGVSQYGNSVVTNKSGIYSCLRLPQPLTGVKELFVVWRDGYRAQCPSYFVGTDEADENVFHRVQAGNGLFATAPATSQLQQGETRLNGQQVVTGQGVYSYNDVFVASAGVGAGCAGGRVEYIGGGKGLFETEMLNRGGLFIGEIVLFTETLTAGERRAINAYLRRKWQGDHDSADLDLGTLTAADGTSVEVVEGSAEIAELDMPVGSTLVKEGAGDLVIGQLAHDNVVFDVRGGRVVLKRNAKPLDDIDVSTYRPPADAHLWLDASKSSSLETDGEGKISKWNDVRDGRNEGGTSACAEPTVKNNARIGVNATIAAGASPSGLSVFDTGAYGDSATAAPFTLKVNTREINRELREIFVVARNGGEGHIFGGSYLELNGMTVERILSDSYSSRYAEAAAATLDGVPVNPIDCAHDPTHFQVYSISASGGVAWNGLAHDRGERVGGCQYGEILVYLRQLTADERREITAYLMKKWLNKDHPDFLKSRSKAQVVIGAGERATVLFTAAGEPDVARTTDAVGPILGRAWAHHACGETSSACTSHFAYPGGRYPNVWAWYGDNAKNDARGYVSVNGSGAFDETTGEYSQTPIIRPTPINGGTERLIVDFGPRITSSAKTGRGLQDINNKGDHNDIREIYVIHADRSTDDRNVLFGTLRTNASKEDGTQYCWNRGSAGELLDGRYAASYLREGTVRVNGSDTNGTTFVPEAGRFYLYTFVPTRHVPCGSVAAKSQTEAGGSAVGEIIFYKGETNTVADQAKVEAHLLKKWFGQGHGPKYDLGTLALTGGTERYADVGGSCDYVPTILSGFGTLDVGENVVSGVSTLSPRGDLSVRANVVSFAEALVLDIVFTAPDAWGRVDVEGAVALPSEANVSVVVPEGVVPQIGRLYPILTATSVTGDISNWTLTVSSAKCPRARLVSTSNGVSLEFVPSGTVVIFR